VKRPFPFHHFLFALSPVLFLYAHNAPRLPIAPAELLIPLGLSVGVSAALWLILCPVFRSARKAALAVSLFVVLFFTHGHLFGGLIRKAGHALPVAILLAMELAGCVVLARLRLELNRPTLLLNFMSLVLVVMNVAGSVPAILRSGARPVVRAGAVSAGKADVPDIYYIILDGFAREDVLREVYDLNDSGFVNWLSEKGFKVARCSRSNYSQTYLSLASSLNMTYLDSVAARTGPESDNRSPLLQMIQANRVMRQLHQHGYTTVSFASGYTGTDLKSADLHYAPRWALSEFANVLISTTPLPLLLERIVRRNQYDLHRERILYAFEHIPDAARLRRPVFVFCHIVSPHPPFVFGANGEKVNPGGSFTLTEGGSVGAIDEDRVRREYIERYRAQTQFIARKTQELVSRLLAESPRPPLVVLQADHGPGSVLNWDDPEPDELAERFAILNACFIPGGGGLIYDSITPVNTFRLLFNRLLGTNYDRLPDRSWFSTISRPWHFYDADNPTEYVKAASGPAVSVVAFVRDSSLDLHSAPAIATFSRRLVLLKYGERKTRLARFYVQPVPDTLSPEQALNRYRALVNSRELPDLGTECDTYSGPGPSRAPVTALFFPASPTANR
jgi:hypothetical protein